MTHRDGQAAAPSEGDSWRNSTFRDEPPKKDPRRWIRRGVGLIAFLTLMLLFVDLNRDSVRCDQDCYGAYRTFEPGHAWTNYPGSWQWEAQNLLAGLAFVLAAAAFVFLIASRLRRALQLTGLSMVVSASWIAWVALSPEIG
jgi:hypothetical protein